MKSPWQGMQQFKKINIHTDKNTCEGNIFVKGHGYIVRQSCLKGATLTTVMNFQYVQMPKQLNIHCILVIDVSADTVLVSGVYFTLIVLITPEDNLLGFQNVQVKDARIHRNA